MNSSATEKRAATHAALHLHIIISGRLPDGAAWSEPTETLDLSTTGASFNLNQQVSTGDHLTVRAYLADGDPVEATAVVSRLVPAVYATSRVSVSILAPADEWALLFRSWSAEDDEAAT